MLSVGQKVKLRFLINNLISYRDKNLEEYLDASDRIDAYYAEIKDNMSDEEKSFLKKQLMR